MEARITAPFGLEGEVFRLAQEEIIERGIINPSSLVVSARIKPRLFSSPVLRLSCWVVNQWGEIIKLRFTRPLVISTKRFAA